MPSESTRAEPRRVVGGGSARRGPSSATIRPGRRVPRVRAEGLALASAAPLYSAGRPHG